MVGVWSESVFHLIVQLPEFRGLVLNTHRSPYRLGQAYLALNEPAKAAVQFRMVLDARDAGCWQVYAPLAQLGLAPAYSAQGDRDSSRKAYAAFFTTWKDADPDIPILKQAKAEYAKLQVVACKSALSVAVPGKFPRASTHNRSQGSRRRKRRRDGLSTSGYEPERPNLHGGLESPLLAFLLCSESGARSLGSCWGLCILLRQG
jgi:hypothetical protein